MTQPELSRPFSLDRLAPGVVEETVTATDAECAALATRLRIPAVRSLTCLWRLRRGEQGRVLAEGTLRARLTRECVITLEEFDAESRDSFRVAFVPESLLTDSDDPEQDDEIGYAGNQIDLGEATAEQLALTLDPYPHKPGAKLPWAGDAEEVAENPFAAALRRRT